MTDKQEISEEICENIVSCQFFVSCSETSEEKCDELKEQYCFGDFTKCARRKLKQQVGKENVPSELKPNQHGIAKDVLNSVQTAK